MFRTHVYRPVEDEGLVERANEIGARARRRLEALKEEHPSVIGEIRAERGAMIAIELVRNGDAAQPDTELTKALVNSAYEHGLVLLSCGVNGNVIRLLPALTIEDALLDAGLDILAGRLQKAVSADIAGAPPA